MERSQLVHLIAPDDWAAAQAMPEVRPASLDEVGFVHLCRVDQLGDVVRRHYADRPSLTVLVLDPDRLGAEVRWEESHPGEHYPHLYGPLPTAAVLDAIRWEPGDDGTWREPPWPVPDGADYS